MTEEELRVIEDAGVGWLSERQLQRIIASHRALHAELTQATEHLHVAQAALREATRLAQIVVDLCALSH